MAAEVSLGMDGAGDGALRPALFVNASHQMIAYREGGQGYSGWHKPLGRRGARAGEAGDCCSAGAAGGAVAGVIGGGVTENLTGAALIACVAADSSGEAGAGSGGPATGSLVFLPECTWSAMPRPFSLFAY